MYNYFTITGDFFYYHPNGDIIDIPHLAATYNIYQFNSTGNLGGLALAENIINNLGGWAGDLRSMIPFVIRDTSNSNTYSVVYNKALSYIGHNNYSFSMPDLLADLDAYNLYNSVDTSSLKNTFTDYYFYWGISTRYADFTNGWSYSTILETTKSSISTSGPVSLVWPIYQVDANGKNTSTKISLTTNQLNAIATAFTDFIWQRIEVHPASLNTSE